MSRNLQHCDCGSELWSAWVYDADRIPLIRTCAVCHDEKMQRFRKDILTVSSAKYGETVETEDDA